MNVERAGRIAPWITVAGVVLQLVGFAIDGFEHARDAALADEALLTASPSHVLLGAGMVLATAGGALWAATALWGRGQRLGSAASAAGLAALALTALVFVAQADGHDHEASAPGAAHLHNHDAIPATAAVSAEPVAAGHGDGHGHAEPAATITEADMALLATQMAEARVAAERYGDIRVALADGYVQVTQDLPGIAAHLIRNDLVEDGVLDPSQPEMLLYSFRDGEWQFWGLSYALPYTGDDTPPEGFAGPLDGWHYHDGLCFRGAAVIGANTSAETCAGRGGIHRERTFWMAHVWVGGPQPSDDLFADRLAALESGASWKVYEPGDPVAAN